MEYLRFSPCSLPSSPWHRCVCPKYDPSPPSLLEIPHSSSPCLSHISHPQSPPSYERGRLGLGSQCSPAGSGCSTIWEGDREGLSAHTQPPSPTASRAVGQTPPVSGEEKHSPFPQCPLPSAQTGLPPTPTSWKYAARGGRERRKEVLKNYYYYFSSSGRKTSPLVKGHQPPAQIFVPTAVAEPKYWHAS